ncbi:hypothetical protein AB6A40_000257 [Gnathostoma spinigerum]|uniref:Uncharacterized protein n=1 Tax=Gnathostoma spinigerum TaxID=75299 RepID=A0ABD6E1U1_9BILA
MVHSLRLSMFRGYLIFRLSPRNNRPVPLLMSHLTASLNQSTVGEITRIHRVICYRRLFCSSNETKFITFTHRHFVICTTYRSCFPEILRFQFVGY